LIRWRGFAEVWFSQAVRYRFGNGQGGAIAPAMGAWRPHRTLRLGLLVLALGPVPAFATFASEAQPPVGRASASLPDAPQAQVATPAPASQISPCLVRRASVGMAYGAASTAFLTPGQAAATGAALSIGKPVAKANAETDALLVPCNSFIAYLPMMKKIPLINWYARFLDGPQVKPMTPKQKAWLAVRNFIDPFNAVTILASSAIAVGSNAQSPYGPGFTGFRRYVGVSYAQDATGEFFGTFLIPSLVHQDPHYHRMPQATLKRRIAHCVYQVVWTQGDNGKGMVNYADVVGFGIDDEVGNLYVPGRETRASASAERYATALATAPIDNIVTEFLPDVARKIHIQVVLIQRIIDQVAKTDTPNNSP
jgi:hypothetical protein